MATGVVKFFNQSKGFGLKLRAAHRSMMAWKSTLRQKLINAVKAPRPLTYRLLLTL